VDDLVTIFTLAFAISCLACLVLTPFAKTFAVRIGAVDKPNERKIHQQAMPRLGGIAIFGSYAISYVLFVRFTDVVATNVGYALLFGGAVVVLTGVLDDLYELSPKKKILGQLIASSIAIYFGLVIEHISLPFMDEPLFLGWLGIPLTILWIVGITNAVNLIDGLDGLASGVSGIAALALFFVSLTIGNTMLAVMTISLVGSIIGFLAFNFHPAKIFMGDSGSLFLGFFLSTISLLELKEATIVSFIIPLLVLAVPISDTLYAMIRRKQNHQPLSVADKGHLHHRLLILGFSHRQSVLLIYGISAVFAILAIVLTEATLWLSLAGLVFYLLFFEIFAESIGMVDQNHRPLFRLYKKITTIFSKK
jgi:UDP-GlcNAc:undecaprenyl-phosphate/decaprenyl-phosphate GlcNAc-1-phosphate transferase